MTPEIFEALDAMDSAAMELRREAKWLASADVAEGAGFRRASVCRDEADALSAAAKALRAAMAEASK